MVATHSHSCTFVEEFSERDLALQAAAATKLFQELDDIVSTPAPAPSSPLELSTITQANVSDFMTLKP